MIRLDYTHRINFHLFPGMDKTHPVMPFEIIGNNKKIYNFLGVIQSGSPWSILNSELAEHLGVDWEKGSKVNLIDSSESFGYLHRLKIRVSPMIESVECDIVFTEFIPEWMNIIGRDGVFDKLIFGIHKSREYLYVSLDENQYWGDTSVP